MTNRFMVSVAALALIAGTGLSNAQGANKESGGASGGATMQQHSTQGETGSAKGSAETKGGMKSSQSEQKSGAMKNNRAEDNTKGSSNQRAEDHGKGTNANQRAEESTKSGTKSEGRDHNNMKAEGREHNNNMKAEGREHNNNMKAEGREHNNNMKAEGRENRTGTNAAESKSTTERSQTTTGQAGAGAKLSTEQRTKITSVIRNEHVAPAKNVNFSIAVGTRVPREGITLHRLPSEVVTIYPEWRGYEYILVRDEIVVIDPATYEIVAVLNA